MQVRDGGVARIDLVALGDQGLGKIVGPARFGALHLDEGGAHGLAGGIRFAALNLINDIDEAFVHFLFIAGIAAKEEVIHVEAIQHD